MKQGRKWAILERYMTGSVLKSENKSWSTLAFFVVFY